MCIEKCISGEIVDIVVSNIPKKYAILSGYVIVINQMRGLYEIYKSRDTRANPETRGRSLSGKGL